MICLETDESRPGVLLVCQQCAARDLHGFGTALLTEQWHARREGFLTLRDDGWDKVRAGVTTVQEVLRVAKA